MINSVQNLKSKQHIGGVKKLA